MAGSKGTSRCTLVCRQNWARIRKSALHRPLLREGAKMKSEGKEVKELERDHSSGGKRAQAEPPPCYERDQVVEKTA